MSARRHRALVYAGIFFGLDALAAGTWLAACGDEPLAVNPLVDAGADAADAGDAFDGFDGNICVLLDAATLDAAAVAYGLTIIKAHKCLDCHGDTLSGNNDGVHYAPDEGGTAYPPNLTQDPVTGLGCWTRDQIVTAILDGIDNMGQPLCPPMPVFSEAGAMALDPSQAEAIAEYLQSLAPVVNTVANTNCPPPGSMPPPDAGGDASAEAGNDASTDAGGDASTDAGGDGGGADASEDADPGDAAGE